MMWQIPVLILLGLFTLLLLFMIKGARYTYKFEERTVKARYLEEARRTLSDYHSPLIETDDPSII